MILARLPRTLVFILFCVIAIGSHATAQVRVSNDPEFYGPFNGVFLSDGDGLIKPLAEKDSVLRADSPWTLSAWINADELPKGLTLLGGIGDPEEDFPRYLALDNGLPTIWLGTDNSIAAQQPIAPSRWHFLVATFDGNEFRLFSYGTQVANGKLALGSVSPTLRMAPPMMPLEVGQVRRANFQHFGGKIASLLLIREALTPERIHQLTQQQPSFALVMFEEGSKPWAVQTRQQAGYRAPQDPATMPRGKGGFSKPSAEKRQAETVLQPSGKNEWTLQGWSLRQIEPDELRGIGPGCCRNGIMRATVPGTVLTTMIDNGIYPDPDYGLNNLAIPESLNKSHYQYITQFEAPPFANGQRVTITFEGINYHAIVSLNGKLLGTITGAFIRGVFDVTKILKPGDRNLLRVSISPPPHPGIPHEQSIKAGAGENGGIMCLDGPTFVATEGWDWIPAIRDRNTGIWQPVKLKVTGTVKIGDPQVVTALPLPDTSRADVEIAIPLENTGDQPLQTVVTANFDQTSVNKTVSVPPGKSSVKFTSAEFKQLVIQNPRLWWPNGYGKQELYRLNVTATADGAESDAKQVRFGIREITYELSLLDRTGHLRRVEFAPTKARAKNERVVDVSHEGMREIPPSDPAPADIPAEWKPFWKSWVASITLGAENSPALRPLEDTRATPYLVIKVNGVRIAARGGNWGMDDSRKRVSRERLEPFFRLHKEANLNIIRNWVGQNTEEVFYDLADEYGMLIFNDFWATTQNYNVEPQDPALFLANARDTVLRFRNHPSIAIWCGRNEGVPQPFLNEGLIALLAELDGTRHYMPSSNVINLAGSGPYKYHDPKLYYTTLARGFSVETGTQSLATLESIRAWTPEADLWPISDTLAYHDWHQAGNGDTAPFMAELQAQFGAPTDLEDFERKAQMLNYVSHRAIFEGMNAHLFAPNSGRMLWMTQPAWPSHMWQIFSHDYDTHAAFYGTKKASEQVHVQLDLTSHHVQVVNNTASALPRTVAVASVYSLENKLLLQNNQVIQAVSASSVLDGPGPDLKPYLDEGQVVLIKLELRNEAKQLLATNFYWLAGRSSDYRALTRMPQVRISSTASFTQSKDKVMVQVRLQNTGKTAALAAKLTLLDASGERILPAYYSDNYISLLSGETRDIQIEYPVSTVRSKPEIAIRGWNVVPSRVLAVQAK
jgi:beta-galactosidase/beta-glucuronidase